MRDLAARAIRVPEPEPDESNSVMRRKTIAGSLQLSPDAAALRARARARRRRDQVAGILWPTGALAAALGAWEAWIRLDHVPRYVMSPFSEVAKLAFQQRDSLLSETWITFREALLGFAAGVVVGVLLALVINASWRFEQAVWPFLIASQVMPVVAFAPAIIVWFGFGLLPKVLIVALFGVFLVAIECLTGLRSLEIEKRWLFSSIGAGRRQQFLHAQLPQALPNLFGGIKLANMFSLTGAVVAEFVASQNGLGHYITYQSSLSNTAATTAGILYLVALGLVSYLVIDLVERLAIPWHASKRGDGSGR